MLPQRLVSFSRVFKVFWVSFYMLRHSLKPKVHSGNIMGWGHSVREGDPHQTQAVSISEAAMLPVPDHSP